MLTALLACLFCGSCGNGDTSDTGAAEATCILYTSLYDCVSCRHAFIAFAARQEHRRQTRFSVALSARRVREYETYLMTAQNARMYFRPDEEFMARYPFLETGDILVLRGVTEVGRLSMLTDEWISSLETMLDKLEQ
jgi:hypothetical protein